MIDINLIRDNKEKVENALRKKIEGISLDKIIELDKNKRSIGTIMEEKRALRKKVSDSIPEIKKNKGDVEPIIKEMAELGNEIDDLNEKYTKIEEELFNELASLPNMPDDDVVSGGKENNRVVSTFGKKPEFSFKPKSHYEIANDLHLIDYERGVKLAGQGSWVYTGMGAMLEWALLNYMIDTHIKDNYTFMLLPHMLKHDCGFTAGQFPKFKDEVYWIDGEYRKDGNFLLPTAESALVSFHRDEILDVNELPKKYFGYTPCYRREAGSSRVEERGTVRGHQFNKIEMVQYTLPDKSDEAFEELLGKAKSIVESLGLHYQVSKLAAGDCSASMARTYDVEVYIPSMNEYKEVSSASNARDYQARRGNLKYRDPITGKPAYLHTLNASGLATSRLLPAVLEYYQNEDGSVTVPEVLIPYMHGITIIK